MSQFKEADGKSFKVGALLVIAALILILMGQTDLVWRNISVGPFLANVGAAFGLVGVLQWVYDHYVRKQFFDDISKTIVTSQSIRDSGFSHFYPDSLKIDYAPYIKNSTRMVALSLYSTRIYKDYFKDISERTKGGKKIHVLALEVAGHTAEYIEKTGWTDKNVIATHRKELDEILQDLPKDHVEITQFDCLPRYTALMFDHDIFLIFNTNSKGRETVPAVLVQKHSPMFSFIENDLTKLIRQSKSA